MSLLVYAGAIPQQHYIALIVTGQTRTMQSPLVFANFVDATSGLLCDGSCILHPFVSVDNHSVMGTPYKHWRGYQECQVESHDVLGNSRAVQFARRRACFNTMLGSERSFGITYTWVVVVRPDLLYRSVLPNPLHLIGKGVHARLTAGNGFPVQGLYTDHFSAHFSPGLPCYIDCAKYHARAKKRKRKGMDTSLNYGYCPCGPEVAPNVDCMVIEDCVALVQRDSAAVYFSFQYTRLQALNTRTGNSRASESISCASKYNSDENALNLTSCSIDGCPEVELTKHLVSNRVSIFPLRGQWVILRTAPKRTSFLNTFRAKFFPKVRKSRCPRA